MSVQTLGGDLDTDGYHLSVSGTGGTSWYLTMNTTLEIRDIAAGPHTVALERVAENCTPSGTHPRSVTVTTGRTVDVDFVVVCTVTGISITTRTTGVGKPDTYDVLLNDQIVSEVPANGSVTLSRLSPGSYAVALNVVSAHCSVAGSNRITVEAARGTVIPVQFDFTCVPTTRSEKIAFVIETTAGAFFRQMIGLVNADGSGIMTLGSGHSPSWSPDGTKLAFSTTLCAFPDYAGFDYCTGGLRLMDTGTSDLTAPGQGDDAFGAAWAPGGDLIAFARSEEANADPGHLYIVGLDGSPAMELAPSVIALADPGWSPDGTRLAFACLVAPPTWDLCVIDRDGTNLVRLTSGPDNVRRPAWSPDGRQIAFARNGDILLMTLEDRSITRLTDGNDPAWSPDGTQLVFAGTDGLFTIHADGSVRTRLTTGRHSAPSWRR